MHRNVNSHISGRSRSQSLGPTTAAEPARPRPRPLSPRGNEAPDLPPVPRTSRSGERLIESYFYREFFTGRAQKTSRVWGLLPGLSGRHTQQLPLEPPIQLPGTCVSLTDRLTQKTEC